MHKIIRLSILGLLTFATFPTGRTPKSIISSDLNGPFQQFDDEAEIFFKYSLNVKCDGMSEELKLCNPTTGAMYSKQTTAKHSHTTSYTNVGFEVDLSKWFGNAGLTFEFSVFYSGTVIQKVSATIYPYEGYSTDISKTNTKRLQGRNVAFKVESNVVKTYADDFNFTGLKNYIDADNYYSLSLRNIEFLHNSQKFFYTQAYMQIKDKNQLFKNMPHTNGNIILPLVIENDEETKSFKFKNKFYVNRLTLEISNVKKDGYVETEKFFLPINKKKDFIGTEMKIVISNCGYSRFNLMFDISYDVSRGLIGDCSNSDYCIKGEID